MDLKLFQEAKKLQKRIESLRYLEGRIRNLLGEYVAREAELDHEGKALFYRLEGEMLKIVENEKNEVKIKFEKL